MKKKATFDNFWIGLLAGFLVPILIFYLYYLSKYGHIPFKEYLTNVSLGLHINILRLSAIADLPLFFAIIQFKRYRTARGVVIACVLFALSVLAFSIFH